MNIELLRKGKNLDYEIGKLNDIIKDDSDDKYYCITSNHHELNIEPTSPLYSKIDNFLKDYRSELQKEFDEL